MANLPLRPHFLQNAGSLRAHDPDQRVTGDKTDQQGNGNKKPVTVNPVFLSLQKGVAFFAFPQRETAYSPSSFLIISMATTLCFIASFSTCTAEDASRFLIAIKTLMCASTLSSVMPSERFSSSR
ncbi:hypothetical protein QE443_003479 [Pantoea ananatis]|nr:hypothetical protein [Pantoea ananatis]MDR6092065.1 hypothetical protein [Pantoea ananatis]PWV64125.1 hypothetical protein C7425_10650 [Pantoea ananatis]REE69242.1 hypothetical protein C7424_2694 [Pantoea ananatis]